MRQWINLINESLTTTVTPSWHDRSENGYTVIEAEMMIRGSLLRVSFKRYMYDPEWAVSFYRNNEISMTGEGGAFTILGAVSGVIDEFVRTRRPIVISMSSKKSETSRTSLYRKLARDFIQRFPEYKISELDTWKSVIIELSKKGGPAPLATEYRGEPVTGEENKPRTRTAAQKARDDALLDRLLADLPDGILDEDLKIETNRDFKPRQEDRCELFLQAARGMSWPEGSVILQPMETDTVDLSWLEASTPRQGFATSSLIRLCKLADEFEVILTLTVPRPTDLDYGYIEQLYAKFGFVRSGARHRIRVPLESNETFHNHHTPRC